jgi:hypothetical protein
LKSVRDVWVLDHDGLRRVDTETAPVTTVVGVGDERSGIYVVGDKLITRVDLMSGVVSIEFASDQVGRGGRTSFIGLKAATVDERGSSMCCCNPR